MVIAVMVTAMKINLTVSVRILPATAHGIVIVSAAALAAKHSVMSALAKLALHGSRYAFLCMVM